MKLQDGQTRYPPTVPDDESAARLCFEQLSAAQRQEAQRRFLDAGAGDGRVYLTDALGTVVARDLVFAPRRRS